MIAVLVELLLFFVGPMLVLGAALIAASALNPVSREMRQRIREADRDLIAQLDALEARNRARDRELGR